MYCEVNKADHDNDCEKWKILNFKKDSFKENLIYVNEFKLKIKSLISFHVNWYSLKKTYFFLYFTFFILINLMLFIHHFISLLSEIEVVYLFYF